MLLLPLSRACATICVLWGAATAIPLGTVDFNDDEVVKTIPNCDFYKANPGSCLTTSVDAPCKYCRAKVIRGFDTAECPGPESFHPSEAGKKQWVVKPSPRKLFIRKQFICAVENAYEGDVGGMGMYAAAGQNDSSSDILGLPSTAWYILLGVFGVAIIAGAAFALSRGSGSGRRRRRRRRDYDDEEDDDDDYDY